MATARTMTLARRGKGGTSRLEWATGKPLSHGARTALGIAAVVLLAVGLIQGIALNRVLLALRVVWAFLVLAAAAVAWPAFCYRRAIVRDSAHKAAWASAAALGCLAAIGLIAVYGTFHAYMADRAMAASITQSSAPIAAYDTRAPFVVAQAQTAGHVTANGDVEQTTYLPASQRFTAGVRGRGLTEGYVQVTDLALDASGQATGGTCEPAALVPRWEGWFGASLSRAVIREAGLGTWANPADSYMACLDGNATLFVPVKRFAGVLFPYEVPAGLVIVDGANGQARFEANVPQGRYPGPVYPMSLSDAQRASTASLGTWWDRQRGRVGYQATKDNDAANAANSGNFNLHRTDGSGDDLVTPLSLIGQARSITAVGVVASNVVQGGRLNPYVIAELPQARQSNSAVVDRLRADYGDLPQWAAGMSVYEIAPSSSASWVATLGMRQAVVYRAIINADSSSCLYTVTGEKVRCSGETPSSTQPGTVSPGADLTTLTDAQLAQLLQAVSDEAARRLQKTP